jgi:hypothetical protein
MKREVIGMLLPGNGLILSVRNLKKASLKVGNGVLSENETQTLHFQTVNELKHALKLKKGNDILIVGAIPQSIIELLAENDVAVNPSEAEFEKSKGLFYRDEFELFKIANTTALGTKALQSDLAITNENVDANTAQLAKLTKDANFDFTSVQPVFHVILNPARASVLQGISIDETTNEIYTSQVATVPGYSGSTESFSVSRLNQYGVLLDQMVLAYGGHGVTFGIERINNTVYIWTNYNITDVNGITIGYKLVRIPYQPGLTVTQDDVSIETYNTFNNNAYTVVVNDNKNKLIAFRYTNSQSKQFIELRNIEDVKAGINNVLGTITIPADLEYLQGMTLDDKDFYWRTGDTNNATYQDEIVLFSFTDGLVKKRIGCSFGKNTNGVYEDGFREPEGIYLYTNPKSGKKSLIASVVTGETGRRIIKTYAYHQTGEGERFLNDLSASFQKIPLTENSGEAKKIPLGLTLLSDIREPGHYYMSTGETVSLTDHPLPGITGWFLEIGGSTGAGKSTYQILRRNTATTKNLIVYYRQMQEGVAVTDWILTAMGSALTIPSTFTKLSDIKKQGTYYMNTAQSSVFTDHPNPGVAGWFFTVNIAEGTGDVYQELKRNSGVGDYETYVRTVLDTGIEGIWEKVGGKFAARIPTGTTLISNIKMPGTYYMDTATSSSLTDHPNVASSGWFLEVEPFDHNGNTQQILKKNSFSGDYVTYVRGVRDDGTKDSWVQTGGKNAKPMPSGLTSLVNFTVPGNYYMTTVESALYSDHPQPNVTGWFLEIGLTNPSGATYQILRKNVTTTASMKNYYRQLDGIGGASAWKSMLPEKVVLWTGTSKADFASTFTLSESLNNFDLVYIRLESDAGINVTDRTIVVSDMASNDVTFQFQNLSDTAGTLGYWMFEYCITLSANKDSFVNKRSIRLKVDAANVQTRTENDGTIGVKTIIGIRL